jgi:Arc/MetJ family transcription regulator
VDDEVVATAARLTGVHEKSTLFRLGLETLVRVESGRRLAELGGSDPAAQAGPRRRPGAAA